MRNACSLLFLEGRSFDISLLDASTGTMLFFSLYIISNRLCFLRSCKVVHSRRSIMLLTDEVLWYRLVTYRAALLWTISNRWMSFCWYGSQTALAYSRVGLTRETYAFFFDRFVGDVYVPFKKTDGVVGFRADGAYSFTPFEVWNGTSQVFCWCIMFEDMSM